MDLDLYFVQYTDGDGGRRASDTLAGVALSLREIRHACEKIHKFSGLSRTGRC